VAMQARVSGVVIIEARIATDGTAEEARVLRSIPLLDQAAIDAGMQWRFTPTLLNGPAVPVIMTVTVNFRPDGAGGGQAAAAARETATQLEPKARSPRVIKDVKPRYPEEGLEAKVSGTVEVAVTIDTDGKVSAAHVVRGIPMFNQAALDAAYQWEFEPVGQPVEVNIEFSFAARSNR